MICDACRETVPGVRLARASPWSGKWICRECWTMPRYVNVRFGLEAEWANFEQRHPQFLVWFPSLEQTMNRVVSRTLMADTVSDKVIFFLGRLAVEDFVEIMLNVGNGYGVAALKLLRTIAERTITMSHLIRHPNEAEAFLNYNFVHERKTVNHIKNAGDDPAKYFSPERLAEIEANYQSVKATFIEDVCRRCGTTRDGMSWTKTDLATMAKNVGLGPYYVALCYFPTLQLHTTLAGINTRVKVIDDAPVFQPGSQRKEADAALWGAHLCLTHVLEEHIGHFRLGVSAKRVRAIYDNCWPGDPGEPAQQT